MTDSAMLLGGMRPVEAPRPDGGQPFAGLYALYAGLIFAPVVRRVIYQFHRKQEP
jgi:hypothetical protein